MPVKKDINSLIEQAGKEVLNTKPVKKDLSDEELLKMFSDPVEKKSPDESGKVGSKDLPQPSTAQEKPSGSPGTDDLQDARDNLFAKDKKSSDYLPKTERQSKIPTNYIDPKSKVDNGFFSSQSTGVQKGPDPNKKVEMEAERIGSEQADQERADELAKLDNKVSAPMSYMATFNQHVYGLPADILKTIAIGSNQLGKLVGEDVPVEDQYTARIADWYRESIKEISPDNPALQEDLGTTVSGALGDLTSLVMSGGIGRPTAAANELQKFSKASNLVKLSAQKGKKIIASPPALVGAIQMGTNEFNQAKASGATDDEAFDAFIKNASVGSILEAIPIMKYFKRLDTTSGGGVKKLLAKGTAQGVDEMTTEVVQQVYSNLNASQTYDKTREWFDGIVDSGGIGFGLGFFLGAMGTSLRKKKAEAKTPEEQVEVQKAIDFVEEKGAELTKKEEALNAETNPGAETGAQQETVTTQQQEPVSEGISTPTDQSIVGVTNEQSDVIPEEQKPLSDNTLNAIQAEVEQVSSQEFNLEKEFKKQDLIQSLDNPQISGPDKAIIEEQIKNIDKPANEEITQTQEGGQANSETPAVQEGQKLEEEPLESSGIVSRIRNLFKAAVSSTSNKMMKETIAPVTETEVEAIKAKTGIDIDPEYKHTIDNYAINHILKNHSDPAKEESRGQIPVAESDFDRIPDIINSYDSVENAGKNDKGLETIRYIKTFPDGVTYYFEEVRTGKKELALNTLYKKKTGEEMKFPSPPPNVQDDQNTGLTPDSNIVTQDTKEGSVNQAEADPDVSGIKKALVSDEIIDGVNLDKISDKEMQELAGKIIATNEVVPENIVNEILTKPRALQPKEVVALIHYKATLDNKLRDAYKKKNELIENGEETGTIDAEIQATENAVENFDIVAVITASQQSLAFRLRKGMLDKDYNLVTQINKYKSVNKGVIPPDVEAKFRELDKKIREVNDQLIDAEKRAKEAEEELAIKNIKESVAREKIKSNIKAASKDIASKIRKKKFHKPGIFSSATPVSVLVDAALEISASTIEAGGTIAQAVADGWNHIKKSDWYKNLTKDKQVEAEEAFADMVSPKEAVESDERLTIPTSLIREAVEQGNATIEDVTKFIQEAIKEDYPNITEREVRDAITKYGKTANLSKDEIDTQIRKIKRIGKLISAIEDVQNKKRPLRSGLQRDKLDAEERILSKQLKEGMKDLPIDAGLQARQLKTSLDAIKSRLQNQIDDLNREIETGEQGAKGKPVPYDEEAKALIEERDRVKALHDDVFGKGDLTDEQKIDRTIKSTERAIAETERRIAEGDLEAKKSKAINSPELQAVRDRLKKTKETLRQLQEEAGIPAKKRLETAKKATERSIEKLQEKLRTNDFSKRTPKPLIADTELTKLQAEKIKLQDEFAKAQYKNELKNRTKLQKAGDIGLELFSSLWRGLAASMDLSAVFVQGLIPTVRHPLDALKSFKEMFKQLASEKYQMQVMANIKAQEWYPAMKASKLAITEIDGKFNAREELFVSNWIDVIWDTPANLVQKAVGQNKVSDAWKKINPYKAANRAYTGYLNSMRVLRFLDGMKYIESQGKTFESHPEEFKAWADYVNNATGRGGLGPLETSAKALSLAFFSPRKVMAGLNLFTPYTFLYVGKMPKAVRQKAILDYASSLAILTTTAILTQAALKGTDDEEEWEVFWNPNSSDFMKPKIGDTRIDLFGGRQQQVVAMARLLSGKFVDANGKVTTLGERFGKDINTRMDVVTKFFSNKFTPSLSFIKKALEQKKGTEIDWVDESTQQVLPIWIRDVDELYKDHPLEMSIMLNILTVLGIGIQTYETKEKKKKKKDKPENK
jgi:hypothetical protein